jgi:hypothetical protein
MMTSGTTASREALTPTAKKCRQASGEAYVNANET